MTKISLTMMLVLVLLAVSCTGKPADTGTPQNPARPAVTSGDVAGTNPDATTNVGGGSEAVVTTDPGAQQSLDAQELLRAGDFEGAITILETMKTNEAQVADLDRMLIDAHIGYTQQIAASRGVDPKTLNEVLYSHYTRILELDPENQEAKMGINAVNVWFEGHGLVLPSEINPTLFLPSAESESSENSGFVAGEQESSEGE